MSDSKCKIINIEDSNTYNHAKIANFQNGRPRYPIKHQCKFLENKDNNKKTIVFASQKSVYIGEESDSENDSYTLLAIRNLKTNKVQLFPVNSVTLNYVHIASEEENCKEIKTVEDSIVHQQNVRDNDSNKSDKNSVSETEQTMDKKYDEDYWVNSNVSDNEDELQTSAANESTFNDDSTNLPDNLFDFLPKINRNAETLDEVYDLNSIITEYDLHCLYEYAEQILYDYNVANKQLTNFVLDCVKKLKQKCINDIEKFEILLFCDAIIKFFKLPATKIKKKNLTIDDYPDNIVEKIINDYTVTVNNVRCRPKSMIRKAASCLIILSLVAMDYEIDLKSLSNELHISFKKIKEISSLMATQPLPKNKNVIVLKLPLPAISVEDK